MSFILLNGGTQSLEMRGITIVSIGVSLLGIIGFTVMFAHDLPALLALRGSLVRLALVADLLALVVIRPVAARRRL